MILSNTYRIFVPVLMFALVACNTPAPAEPPAPAEIAAPTTAPTTAPTPEPPTPDTANEPTTAPVAETPPLSFTPATYIDESASFALDYPADWSVEPSSQIGVRGGQALLLSPGTTVETLANGGTRVSITTYIWDPKNDLDAYIAQRKVAWEASGFTIVSEEPWQLADGRAAYVFVVQTPEQPTFMLFTTVGEDYLQIAGEGDATLAAEIAHTLRPSN